MLSLVGSSSLWIVSLHDLLLFGLGNFSSGRPNILAWVDALCFLAWALRASSVLTEGLMSPRFVAVSLSTSSSSLSDVSLLSLTGGELWSGRMASRRLGRSLFFLSMGLDRPADRLDRRGVDVSVWVSSWSKEEDLVSIERTGGRVLVLRDSGK